MYESERQVLVEKLIENGIKDELVIRAMLLVERHKFVPEIMIPHAYKDVALPIGYDQTISQPYTVAFMTQCLHLKQGNKVLEIGTGSGYQAAVLYRMGMKVYSIERNPEIFLRTQKLFDEMGTRVVCRLGDGTLGWQEFAPYDGIIVTAGGPSIPPNLLKQLEIGGRLVIPVGDKKSQILKIILRENDDKYSTEDIPRFAFVPLIGREGWSQK